MEYAIIDIIKFKVVDIIEAHENKKFLFLVDFNLSFHWAIFSLIIMI